jgi:hypothetical protein
VNWDLRSARLPAIRKAVQRRPRQAHHAPIRRPRRRNRHSTQVAVLWASPPPPDSAISSLYRYTSAMPPVAHRPKLLHCRCSPATGSRLSGSSTCLLHSPIGTDKRPPPRGSSRLPTPPNGSGCAQRLRLRGRRVKAPPAQRVAAVEVRLANLMFGSWPCTSFELLSRGNRSRRDGFWPSCRFWLGCYAAAFGNAATNGLGDQRLGRFVQTGA